MLAIIVPDEIVELEHNVKTSAAVLAIFLLPSEPRGSPYMNITDQTRNNYIRVPEEVGELCEYNIISRYNILLFL